MIFFISEQSWQASLDLYFGGHFHSTANYNSSFSLQKHWLHQKRTSWISPDINKIAVKSRLMLPYQPIPCMHLHYYITHNETLPPITFLWYQTGGEDLPGLDSCVCLHVPVHVWHLRKGQVILSLTPVFIVCEAPSCATDTGALRHLQQRPMRPMGMMPTKTHTPEGACTVIDARACVWTVMLVRRVLGVESNLLRIIHASVRSGNLRILLHFVGHTRLYSRSFRPICHDRRDQL